MSKWLEFLRNNTIMRTSMYCFLCLGGLIACYPEEQEIDPTPSHQLYFSEDTLHFDTLISGTRSPAQSVRLHNPNNGALILERIWLERGANSPFSCWVKGSQGTSFQNIRLIGRDSTYILMEANIRGKERIGIVEELDKLWVQSSLGQHYLPIKASSRDVIYADHLLISQDTDWSNTPSRHIGTELRVAANATLKLGPGMHLFFAQDAGIEVEGRLEAIGSFEEPIVLTSERQDDDYKDAPGQWRGIHLKAGTSGHQLLHLRIHNAELALKLGAEEETQGVKLSISYTELSYLSEGAILSYRSQTFTYNTVIYNTGRYLIQHHGGTHEYLHCTLSSYPRYFFNPAPIFQLHTHSPANSEPPQTPSLQIRNSILWSSEETIFSTHNPDPSPMIEVSYSILSGEPPNHPITSMENLWSNEHNYPAFLDPVDYNYKPTSTSPARDAAHDFRDNRQYKNDTYYDIKGHPRDNKPDIGAYEWKPPTD